MLTFSEALSKPGHRLAKINLKFSVARKRHFSTERKREREFINDIIIHKAGSILAATAKEINHFPIRAIEYLLSALLCFTIFFLSIAFVK